MKDNTMCVCMHMCTYFMGEGCVSVHTYAAAMLAGSLTKHTFKTKFQTTVPIPDI
jgi:hypothetical protein